MRQRRGEADRFWEKVVKGPRPQDCGIWIGAVDDDGYGRFWFIRDGEQRALRPQRYAYEHLTGQTLHSGIALMAHDLGIDARNRWSPLRSTRSPGGEDETSQSSC
jgi:hypothetical protein